MNKDFEKIENLIKDMGYEDEVRKAKYHSLISVIKKNEFIPSSKLLIIHLLTHKDEIKKLSNNDKIKEIIKAYEFINLINEVGADEETISNIKDYLKL